MKSVQVAVAVGIFSAVLAAGWGLGQTDDRQNKDRPDVRGDIHMRHSGLGPGWGIMAQGLHEWVIRRLVTDTKLATELGLTEAQIHAIKEAVEGARKEREGLRKQLAELQQQQWKLMEEPTADEEALFALVEKASPIRLELDKINLKLILAVKKTLTADQMLQIREKMQTFRRNRAEGERGGPWRRDEKQGNGGKRGRQEGGDIGQPVVAPGTTPAVW